MLNKFIIILVNIASLLYVANATAQVKKTNKHITKKKVSEKTEKVTEYTHWNVRTGFNMSIVYLVHNVSDKNHEIGYSTGLLYEINDYFRVSSSYSHFSPTDLKPTWLYVNANSYETNLEILTTFPNQKSILYPIVGFSYNTFRGFFVGKSDYLNLSKHYSTNTIVKNQWLGVNLGIGLEHNFGILGLFIDYRMRLGKLEKNFNVMDICYTGGLKINIPKMKLKLKIRHFSLNDRFHWF